MSTTLPHGIIQINEGNIAWYGDITANWQLIDSKIGIYDAAIASIPAPANTGTLTINYGGTTLAMFGADDAGDVSADIPAPGNGTLTIQQNGTTVDSFSANSSSDKTVNIQCVDLANNQTIGGNKEFTGTTTAHDVVPSATDTYNLGTSTNKWKSLNGINPGALSLPGTDFVSLDTTSWDMTGVSVNYYTPIIDAWMMINVSPSNNIAYVSAEYGTMRFNSESTTGRNAMITIPVLTNKQVSIVIVGASIVQARLIPCQGNV